MVRIVGSKLCTFIGKRRDPGELLDRLVSAGLLAENANPQKVLAVIQAAFEAEARRFDVDDFPNAGEVRAHMVLDQRLFPYLSSRGVALMRTPDYWQSFKDRHLRAFRVSVSKLTLRGRSHG